MKENLSGNRQREEMEREETGSRGRGCGFEKLRDEEKRSGGRGERCRTIVLRCVPLWWESKAGERTGWDCSDASAPLSAGISAPHCCWQGAVYLVCSVLPSNWPESQFPCRLPVSVV